VRSAHRPALANIFGDEPIEAVMKGGGAISAWFASRKLRPTPTIRQSGKDFDPLE